MPCTHALLMLARARHATARSRARERAALFLETPIGVHLSFAELIWLVGAIDVANV